VGTDALSQLACRKQASGFNHRPFAMNPFGLNRIEPRALRRQAERQDAHAFADQLDLLVVLPDPGAHDFADIPRGIVPDQQPGFFALSYQAPAASIKKLSSNITYGVSSDKTQPHFFAHGIIWGTRLPEYSVTSQRFRVGVPFFPRLLNQVHWLFLIVPGVHARLGNATPPHLVQEASGPSGLLANPGNQHAIAQMLQIAWPHALEMTAVGQLLKDCIDEIAHMPQDGTLIGLRLWRVGFAQRRWQKQSLASQEGLQIRKPVVAISQRDILSALQDHRLNLSISFIDWCQDCMRDQAKPAQAHMQTKAVKGLTIGIILAITGDVAKTEIPRGTCKATNGRGHAIDDSQQWIMAHCLITQPILQTLLDGPQIGCLSHKRREVHVSQRWEKVRVVLKEVGKKCLILAEPQIRADHFDGEHFAITQFGQRAALAKPLSSCGDWYHLVNPAKHVTMKSSRFMKVPSEAFC